MNPSAIILPIPRDPPVISATRPLSENRSFVFIAGDSSLLVTIWGSILAQAAAALCNRRFPFLWPSLMAQRQKSGSRLRHGLMFQTVRADLAVDAAVGQPLDGNQLRWHL